MSSECSEGKGVVTITPSARKSIHSYKNPQLITTESMVRYGYPDRRKDRANLPSNSDQGIDVVDNIISKPLRQTSPLSIKKKKLQRINSYSQDEETTSDNDNVLSKSLPAILPSHLSCSDYSDLEELNYSANSMSKSRIEEESHHSTTINRSKRSNTSSERIQRSPYMNSSITSRDEIPNKSSQLQSSNTTRNIVLLTLVIGTIATVYMKFYYLKTNNNQDRSTQTMNYDKIQFENNMNNLQKKYNIDENSILKLKTGISTIFSRMDTGSFMIFYNSKANNFNPMQFDKFIDEVAYTAARYLRNNISPNQHTVVESSNLDMQDHGELITRYRDDVDKSGVMLVKEIDGVPSELAMAFHYYCDEYEPLVKRSAIFFTLNMANCSDISDKKSTYDLIEKCLARKWKTVPPENMRPLLTRVVDLIIDVTNVF